jgi:hypothetical protein
MLEMSTTTDTEDKKFSELNPDPKILEDLEIHAKSISSNLDMALRDLRGALRGISDLSLESMQVFSTIIHENCDSVDAVVRSTYTVTFYSSI